MADHETGGGAVPPYRPGPKTATASHWLTIRHAWIEWVHCSPQSLP